jgi:serine/threonine protein kinase/tetratricopeptide (TPR) repeat protein
MRLMAEDQPTSTGVPLSPTVGPTVTRFAGAPVDIDVPERIGPYRITGVLGTGGMGVVLRADQTEPVQREVALKIIKLGMDTKDVVTRFEAERQALALMDHPNIARVYEAGATETGRPYFAMELVRGVPLTKYCDGEKLRTRQRVELFIQVCQAVQHAHQKGVIHRDLKPSNVLVTVTDGRPVPKVIDFGIAKAMDRRLTDRTLVTELGQIIGTPLYMSPEQLETCLDVDTRADVYSLGVMLYELLTGTLPRRAEELLASTTASRVHDDPPVPSLRVATLAGGADDTAALRQTDRNALRRELKGDLDWITMKAVARERTHRYETVNGLSLDLQRALKNEPIAARPPSARYRLGKFAKRHKGGVAFAAALALLVLGFAVAMGIQAQRVTVERDRAEREASRANAINAFLQDVLGSADPWERGSRTITLADALGKATDRIGTAFANEPLTAAAVRRTIAKTYSGLGLYDRAEPLLQSALAAQKAALGPEHAELVETLGEMGALRERQGRYDDALALHREALVLARRRFGEKGAPVARSLLRLAQALFQKGDYAESERAATEALALQRQLFGPESEEAAASLNVLMTTAATGRADYAAGDAAGREALAIRRKRLGPEHPDIALTLNDLAVVQLQRGDFAAAIPLYEESLAMYRHLFGEEHPEVASTMENLGGAYFKLKRYDETIALLQKVLAMRRTMLGEESMAVARTLTNMGTVYTQAGDYAAAEAAYRDSIGRLKRTLGADHPDVSIALYNLAGLFKAKGDYAAAEQTCREALALALRKLGEQHPHTADVRVRLGAVLVAVGRYAEAETLLVQGRAAREKLSGPDHGNTRKAVEELVKLYEAWGKPEKAAALRSSLPSTPDNAPPKKG